MFRLSDKLKLLEDKVEGYLKVHRDDLPKLIAFGLLILYLYGMIVRCLIASFTWNPIKNLSAALSPAGFGLTLFVGILYCLFTKKGYALLTGYKTVIDKLRGIELLPEGTHGTSGWMDKKEMTAFLETGTVEQMTSTLFGKLLSGEYVGMRNLPGMSGNIIVYGAPGSGKSRGFVMPFAMQAARRGESLVLADPKAEFYDLYATFFRDNGYTVRAYNLLDLFASDGWNCVIDTADDVNLVQRVAEVIIRNTSSECDKDDFWAKAEKNLLLALLHYVQTMTYPGTNRLLPPEERSLGTIYKILSTTSVQELDARFRSLPPDHPALPPYGIFRQAHKQIWGNIVIGLGNRLNVFQNRLVDSITKHNEIDLTLPGHEKCAYFCIISDQDSSLEFLSSMFFSLMFAKLFDYARGQPNRRLPICVNMLMDEFCNIRLPDSKKIFSVARSRNINIQAVTQSIAQLSDRYPRNEWLEIVGDCDYQLFLGCNDTMTAEFISKQCGNITIRAHSASIPVSPLPVPMTGARPYTENKSSIGRPLMMPDEVRRLPKDQAILLIRGAKPLLLQKIVPEEHPLFHELTPCKAADHIPEWKNKEASQPGATVAQSFFSPEPPDIPDDINDDAEYPPVPDMDISRSVDCRQLHITDPTTI